MRKTTFLRAYMYMECTECWSYVHEIIYLLPLKICTLYIIIIDTLQRLDTA